MTQIWHRYDTNVTDKNGKNVTLKTMTHFDLYNYWINVTWIWHKCDIYDIDMTQIDINVAQMWQDLTQIDIHVTQHDIDMTQHDIAMTQIDITYLAA